MEKEETRKKLLMEAKKGDVLAIGYDRLKITKVAEYELCTASWRTIAYDAFCPMVCELTSENAVNIWKKFPLSTKTHILDKAIFIGEEKFEREETGRPLVTIAGEKAERINYSVFVNKDNVAICLEWWPGKEVEAYELIREVHISHINVIKR